MVLGRFRTAFANCYKDRVLFILPVLLLLLSTSCATFTEDTPQRVYLEKSAVPELPITPDEAQHLQALATYTPFMEALLVQLISIDSVNQLLVEGSNDIFFAAKDVLQSSGAEVELIPVQTPHGRVYNLIAVVEGDHPGPTMLFSGHMDTVPYQSELWDAGIQPLSGVRIGDRIYGRGALDMKGGVAVMMTVMAYLAESQALSAGRLMLLLTPDEETGGAYGTAVIARDYPDILHSDMTIIAEPTQFFPLATPAVAYGEKGVLWVRFLFTGDAGHSSSSGITAGSLDSALRFVSQLESFTFPGSSDIKNSRVIRELRKRFTFGDLLRLRRDFSDGASDLSLFSQSTLSVTDIATAPRTIANQMPASTEVIVDFRLMPGVTIPMMTHQIVSFMTDLGFAVELCDEFRVHYDDQKPDAPDVRIEVMFAKEGSQESLDSAETEFITQVFEAVYRTQPLYMLSPGFTDAGNLRSSGLRNIYIIGPKGDGAHAVHEYVTASSMESLAAFYLTAALRFLQADGP